MTIENIKIENIKTEALNYKNEINAFRKKYYLNLIYSLGHHIANSIKNATDNDWKALNKVINIKKKRNGNLSGDNYKSATISLTMVSPEIVSQDRYSDLYSKKFGNTNFWDQLDQESGYEGILDKSSNSLKGSNNWVKNEKIKDPFMEKLNEEISQYLSLINSIPINDSETKTLSIKVSDIKNAEDIWKNILNPEHLTSLNYEIMNNNLIVKTSSETTKKIKI